MRCKPALALSQLAYSQYQTTKENKPLIRINAQPSSNQIKFGPDSIYSICTLNTYKKNNQLQGFSFNISCKIQ